MDDAKRHLSNLDDLYLLVGTPWMRLSLLLRPEPVVRQNEVVLISKPALCRTRETGCVSRRVVNLLPLGTYTAMQSDHQPTINRPSTNEHLTSPHTFHQLHQKDPLNTTLRVRQRALPGHALWICALLSTTHPW
jgi:hypothetical protein